jgi:Calcineurin-like phosphoesterase
MPRENTSALAWRMRPLHLFLVAGTLSLAAAYSAGQTAKPGEAAAAPWKFAVSGDSRNCGDVVMPAIAAAVGKSGASFYWHLGDFRKMSEIDEDIQQQPEHLKNPLTIPEYRRLAWNDFIRNQLQPFGSLPVYLTRGNHELIARPSADADYLQEFAGWLDQPNLRAQRLADNPDNRDPEIYYHWVENGVDFISLDNGSSQFELVQLSWLERVLARDRADPGILTIVAGMHEALPESISKSHSMNQTAPGTESGRRAYRDLLDTQTKGRKHVYVLASHSHYFMDGIFNTPYWRAHGGVLPGWIVGTAGAERYALPPEKSWAKAAETNVYGFLLATVSPSDEIRFDFERLNEHDVPETVGARYTPQFVDWCFAQNSRAAGKASGK